VKNATVSVLLVGVLGAGFLAGTWYRPRQTVNAAGARPRAVRYYVDPMHPSYTSDRPGVAPDCGMALQPVYEAGDDAAVAAADGGAPAAVTVSPQQEQLIGVRVAAVETAAGRQRLRLSGRVVPDETRVYRVTVGIEGIVREVSTVTTGSLVSKDQWLATFAAPEARAPVQTYLVAVDVVDRAIRGAEAPAAVDFANAALQQTADRLATLGMSSAQIETIRRTRQMPATIRLAAPEAGFVIARNVSIGQKLDRGDELYRLADLRRVWIVADVFGADAEHVRPGAIAEISVPGRRRTLRGRVSGVPPQFNAANQSAAVRLDVDNPGFALRPEMFVDVDLIVTRPQSIAIPADAIIESGLKKSVFVERAAGVFEPRQVETGWRLGRRVEIVAGLQAGERIAVEGVFLLDAERRIRRMPSEVASRP
jgi:membrane fusion protein, copper/silver efflux system